MMLDDVSVAGHGLALEGHGEPRLPSTSRPNQVWLPMPTGGVDTGGGDCLALGADRPVLRADVERDVADVGTNETSMDATTVATTAASRGAGIRQPGTPVISTPSGVEPH